MPAMNRFTPVLLAAIVAIGAFVLLRRAETSELTRGADVAVSCGEAQRAVVRQTVTSGTPHVDIQCVDGAAGQAASYVVDESGRVLRVTDEREVGRVPAGYAPIAMPQQPALVPAVYQPAPAPAVQRVAAAPVRTTQAPTRDARKRGPSWQKRALVIGGTAGAGAGIGALVGGKKGALIGAAVGGGGAALVDVLKRE